MLWFSEELLKAFKHCCVYHGIGIGSCNFISFPYSSAKHNVTIRNERTLIAAVCGDFLTQILSHSRLAPSCTVFYQVEHLWDDFDKGQKTWQRPK